MKPNLEQRLRATLDADFQEFVWNLQPGDKIGLWRYQGSWIPRGTQEFFPATFVCISGSDIVCLDHDNRIVRTSNVCTEADLIRHVQIIEKYREENPDWATAAM